MRLLFILSFVLLASCASTERHNILGTNYGWNKEDKDVKILIDAKVDSLRVRKVRMKSIDCTDGYIEHIEMDGPIGPDSTAIVEKILPKIKPCYNKNGVKIVPRIFMSSGGGLLADGYNMGRLFKKYDAQTIITGGQKCSSSCAIAFLGGKYRTINHNGEILFHSPYTKGMLAIDCTKKSDMDDLLNYYSESIGERDANFLFDRTMSYCSNTSGWTLNADAAKIFGITNWPN